MSDEIEEESHARGDGQWIRMLRDDYDDMRVEVERLRNIAHAAQQDRDIAEERYGEARGRVEALSDLVRSLRRFVPVEPFPDLTERIDRALARSASDTSTATRDHHLAWNGTEWVDDRCGCRYHPDDDNGSHGGAPHVHRCERHSGSPGEAESGPPTRDETKPPPGWERGHDGLTYRKPSNVVTLAEAWAIYDREHNHG